MITNAEIKSGFCENRWCLGYISAFNRVKCFGRKSLTLYTMEHPTLTASGSVWLQVKFICNDHRVHKAHEKKFSEVLDQVQGFPIQKNNNKKKRDIEKGSFVVPCS